MRRTWEAAIQQMARDDADFRKALEADPRKALEGKIGAKLPSNVNVHVVCETPKDVYVVLPMDSSTEAQAIQAEAAHDDMNPTPQASGGSWSTCGKELTCWCVTTTTCTNASTVHGSC